MSDPLVALQHVSKWYASDPGRHVLSEIDLTVAPGERFAVIGPSGCGKSTLLNLLGTLDQPSEGEVRFDGASLAAATPDELANLRARDIGFIFQLHHLLPQCTALENVLVPTLAKASDPLAAESRARDLLGRVGLADKASSKPGELSGGERQRVAVVRALINQPRLVLADEPTGALDEENADLLTELLIELNEAEGTALVMVTHNPAQARRLGSVRRLRAGRFETDS